MVLNAAYLLDAGAVAELHAQVGELQERHAQYDARVQLSGPWPPYNFVTGETATQPA
jgi:hypothetical protein